MWRWVSGAGALVVVTGLLPLPEATALLERVAPVLVFLVVQTVAERGLSALLADLAGTGEGGLDLLRLAGAGALASNAVNNRPAYLALEPAAEDSALRLAALLVGTNAGPLVTPWGSLATLLWWDRCRAAGARVPIVHVMALGLLAAPVAVVAGVAGLLLAARVGLVG